MANTNCGGMHSAGFGARQSAHESVTLRAWAAMTDRVRAGEGSGGDAVCGGGRPRPRTIRDRSKMGWSPGEDAALTDGYRLGQGIEVLAHSHQRSRPAVMRRLDRLGLLRLEDRIRPRAAVPVAAMLVS